MVGIQAKFRLDSVESIVYADESSKNDSISEINKSIEPLDGMNDLLVTKGVTLDNSNKLSKTRERVPKFIDRTPLINLDDYELRPMMMMIMMKMKTETRSMCLRQKFIKKHKGGEQVIFLHKEVPCTKIESPERRRGN
ncbi:hypothetical protein KY284_026331 [Solanum tuberosum]|nr:hypothetical protein KY284_026331 [Solanum tuberosum]